MDDRCALTIPVFSSAFLRLDFFDRIGIRNLLSFTNYIHAFGITGVLNVAPENDGGVFFIKLHHVADTFHLLTSHERRAAAASKTVKRRICAGRFFRYLCILQRFRILTCRRVRCIIIVIEIGIWRLMHLL